MFDLSLVITSNRKKWLTNCLYQYKSQIKDTLTVEVIVITEGNCKDYIPICDYFKITTFTHLEGNSPYGIRGKDIGVSMARGEYVCWWDDDNIWYPHALKTLYETAKSFDIGIARVEYQGRDFLIMPWQDKIELGQVDTQNFCVKTELARKAKWVDHPGQYAFDYAYISKLLAFNPTVNYSSVSIGLKLLD